MVNLSNFQIEEVHGIQRWLGYSEKSFSFEQYWNHVIHPGKHFLKLLARQMYEGFCKGFYPLKFKVQRFTSLVPLRHYKGHFLLVKKTSSTFQYDINNRLIAYLNEFIIIGNYEGEALKPRIFNLCTEQEVKKEKEIIKKAVDSFIAMKVFTACEFQIARKLAYNPQLTQLQIAKELHLSVQTVQTYYKRFLSKAKDFFGEDFHSVLGISIYLRKEGLL